jgi:AcrR family transcriptional regulator
MPAPSGTPATGEPAGGPSAAGQTTVGQIEIPPEPVTVRGEQTKALIVETALRHFRENGYDQTTMRGIARDAGVSVGNAYYYFASKEHLIQAFYDNVQVEHLTRARESMGDGTDFGERLRLAMHAGIDALTPYHEFAGKFFKTAAEPTSPLHPLSTESSGARDASIVLFREVFDGSKVRVDPELTAELPELLWMSYLGVILFWVHDLSPGQAKTRLFIDKVTPMIDRLVSLSRLRILRPMSRELLELIAALKA